MSSSDELLHGLVIVVFSMLNLIVLIFAAGLVYQQRRGKFVVRRASPGDSPRQIAPLRLYLFGMYCEAISIPLYAVLVVRFKFRLVPAWVVFTFIICVCAGMALLTVNYLSVHRRQPPTPS